MFVQLPGSGRWPRATPGPGRMRALARVCQPGAPLQAGAVLFAARYAQAQAGAVEKPRSASSQAVRTGHHAGATSYCTNKGGAGGGARKGQASGRGRGRYGGQRQAADASGV